MEPTSPAALRRVLLLLTAKTYRAQPFLDAAQRLGIDVLKLVDMPQPLAEFWNMSQGVDFSDLETATRAVVDLAAQLPFQAIVSVDDSGSWLAAQASAALGLPHNSPDAAEAARNKYRMRSLLAAGGVPVPHFQLFSTEDDPRGIHFARHRHFELTLRVLHALATERGFLPASVFLLSQLPQRRA